MAVIDDYTLTTTEDGNLVARDAEGRTISAQDYYERLVDETYVNETGRASTFNDPGGRQYWLDSLMSNQVAPDRLDDIFNASDEGKAYDARTGNTGGGTTGGGTTGGGTTGGGTTGGGTTGGGTTGGGTTGGGALTRAQADSLVTRLYDGQFGRKPTQADLDYWAPQVVAGNLNEEGLLREYNASDEGRMFDRIGDLYPLETGRPADSGGQAYYAGQVRDGKITYDQIAKLISESKEGRNFDLDNLSKGILTTGYVDPTLTARLTKITTGYKTRFGRDPDEKGLRFFLGQEDENYDFNQALAKSPEALVRDAFKRVLGRAPDAEAVAYYMDELKQGRTYDQIVSDLRKSDEYQTKVSPARGIDGVLYSNPATAARAATNFAGFPLVSKARTGADGKVTNTLELDLPKRDAFSLGVKKDAFKAYTPTVYSENPYVTNVFGGPSAADASRTGVGAQKVFSNAATATQDYSTLGIGTKGGITSLADVTKVATASPFTEDTTTTVGTNGANTTTVGTGGANTTTVGTGDDLIITRRADTTYPNEIVGKSGYAPGDVYGAGGKSLVNYAPGNAGGNSTVVSLLSDGYASPSDIDQMRYLYEASNKTNPGSGDFILNTVSQFDKTGSVKSGILGLDASTVRGPITSSSGALGDPNMTVTYAGGGGPKILNDSSGAFGGTGNMSDILAGMSGNVAGAINLGANPDVTSVTRNPAPNVLNPDGTVNLSNVNRLGGVEGRLVSALGTGAVGLAQGGMIMSDPVMRRAMFRNGGPVSAKGLGITSNVTTPDENAMAMQTMFQPPGFRDGGPVQYFEDGGEATVPVEPAAPTPLEALRAQVRTSEPRFKSVMERVREERMLPIDLEQEYTGRSMRGENPVQERPGFRPKMESMTPERRAAERRLAIDDADERAATAGPPGGIGGFFGSVFDRTKEILSGRPRATPAPSAEGADLRRQANQQMAERRQSIDDRDAMDREGLTRVSEDRKTPPPDAERKAPVRDRLTIRLDELKAEREANKAQRKENQLLALMQAGFAMAAGRSPNALANISAGGASGVATLADLEKGRRAEDAALRREILETELAGERTSEARAERQAAREDRTLSRDVAALKSEQDLNARYAIAANSEKRQLNDIIGDNTGKFSEDKKKEAAAQLLVLEQNLRQRELRERELSRALSPRSVQQGSGDFRAREVGSPRPTPQR